MSCWVTMHPVFPINPRVDLGIVFVSTICKKIFDDIGLSLQYSGVDCHNSLGIGECYHAPLCRIFLKIITRTPNLGMQLYIKIAVKDMNCSLGQKNLYPLFWFFGFFLEYILQKQNFRNKLKELILCESKTTRWSISLKRIVYEKLFYQNYHLHLTT